MGEEFNPYSEWLGIPAESVPIDHYRLLGITPFESDPDTISQAAEQRIALIKTHLQGSHTAVSKRLLGEIAAARMVLFNAEKRSRYNTRLRQKQAQAESSSKAVTAKFSPVQAVEQEQVSEEALFPGIQTSPTSPSTVSKSTADRHPAEKKGTSLSTRMLFVTIGVGAIAALGVLLIVYQLVTKSSTEIAEVTNLSTDNSTNSQKIDESESTNDPKKPSDRKGSVVITPIEEDSGKETSSGRKDSTPSATEENLSTMKPTEKPTEKSTKEPAKRPGKGPNRNPLPREKPPEVSAEQPSEKGFFSDSSKEKAPIPDSESQRLAEKKVNEIFRLASLTTSQEKVKAAKGLFQAAEETKDELPMRFVLLKLATRLAAEGGDVKRSMEVIDTIGQSFKSDPLAMKVYTLSQASKKAGTGTEALTLNTQLVMVAMPLAERAMQEDDYKAASNLIEEVALPSVRRCRDKLLLQEVSQRRTELRARKEKYADVGRAKKTLIETPDDPVANLEVGCWYVIERGDWEKGMPYLAKGSDSALVQLAKLEISQPTDVEKQFALGDIWWELADDKHRNFSDVVIERFHDRGAYWYRQALPKLSGIRKLKVEQRLEATGTTKEGDYALRFDGSASYVVVNFAYDGSAPITIEVIVRPDSHYSSGSLFGNYNYNYGHDNAGGLDLYSSSGDWIFRFYETYIYSTSYSTYERKDYIYLRANSSNRSSSYNSSRRKPQPWVHLAGVYDGAQIRLYIDGVVKASQALRGRHSPQNVLPFVIGASPEGLAQPPTGVVTDDHFRGDMKAVRISSVPRYTADFKPPEQLTREDTATKLLLVFNKGEGDIIQDGSGKKALIRDSNGRKKLVTVTGAIRNAKWIKLDAQGK